MAKENTQFKKGMTPWNKEKKDWMSLESKEKVAEANRKRMLGNKITLGYKHTKEAKEKISEASRKQIRREEWGENISKGKLGKKRPDITGEKSLFWKGGISKITRTERRNLMGTSEYRVWRTSVFERDTFSCRWCKAQGFVYADHIKPYAFFPELRLSVENGQTLCGRCHAWKTMVDRKIYAEI